MLWTLRDNDLWLWSSHGSVLSSYRMTIWTMVSSDSRPCFTRLCTNRAQIFAWNRWQTRVFDRWQQTLLRPVQFPASSAERDVLLRLSQGAWHSAWWCITATYRLKVEQSTASVKCRQFKIFQPYFILISAILSSNNTVFGYILRSFFRHINASCRCFRTRVLTCIRVDSRLSDTFPVQRLSTWFLMLSNVRSLSRQFPVRVTWIEDTFYSKQTVASDGRGNNAFTPMLANS